MIHIEIYSSILGLIPHLDFLRKSSITSKDQLSELVFTVCLVQHLG